MLVAPAASALDAILPLASYRRTTTWLLTQTNLNDLHHNPRTGFATELAAAPVNAAAMAAAITAVPAQPAPAALRLAARAAGPLTGCAATVRDLYLRQTQTATTDDKGAATTTLPVSGVLVSGSSSSSSNSSSSSAHATAVLCWLQVPCLRRPY